jgi:hypothetical protein
MNIEESGKELENNLENNFKEVYFCEHIRSIKSAIIEEGKSFLSNNVKY